LVAGKLFAATFFLWLLLFTAVPLQGLAYLFGGVAVEEILIAIVTLLITAFAFSALGLFFSSLVKRTLISTVLSYGTALIVVFGIPTLLLLAFSIYNSLFFTASSQPGLAFQGVLLGIAWFLISLNPLATAGITELILLEEQSAFSVLIPLASGQTFTFISPWISYSVFYLIISLLLTWISIKLVQRGDR
jgi:ABC-type transport system involved in multi-copper enzyme maturation permease subunit